MRSKPPSPLRPPHASAKLHARLLCVCHTLSLRPHPTSLPCAVGCSWLPNITSLLCVARALPSRGYSCTCGCQSPCLQPSLPHVTSRHLSSRLTFHIKRRGVCLPVGADLDTCGLATSARPAPHRIPLFPTMSVRSSHAYVAGPSPPSNFQALRYPSSS